GGVALADDEQALIDEIARIGGNLGVQLGQLDAGNGRDVKLRDAGGDEEPAAKVDSAGGLLDAEAALDASDASGASVVADVKAVVGSEVVEVANEIVGGREVAGAVVLHEQARLIAEKGVPVPAEVALRVGEPSVDLVTRDKGAV